jgi:hypothetical protein
LRTTKRKSAVKMRRQRGEEKKQKTTMDIDVYNVYDDRMSISGRIGVEINTIPGEPCPHAAPTDERPDGIGTQSDASTSREPSSSKKSAQAPPRSHMDFHSVAGGCGITLAGCSGSMFSALNNPGGSARSDSGWSAAALTR